MSQSSKILQHLRKRPLTPLQALSYYGCLRLAARIADLRKKGYIIHTETVRKNKKKFAKYVLN